MWKEVVGEGWGGKTRNEWKSSGKCYLKKERGVTRTDRGYRDRGKGIR